MSYKLYIIYVETKHMYIFQLKDGATNKRKPFKILHPPFSLIFPSSNFYYIIKSLISIFMPQFRR